MENASRQKRLLHLRLPGSSLVEVLVALSLSSIVFVIGMMVWLQINGTQAPYRRLDYRMRGRSLIEQAVQAQGLLDDTYRVGGVQFVRKIRPIYAPNGLYEIRIHVFGQGDELLLTRGKIVVYETD